MSQLMTQAQLESFLSEQFPAALDFARIERVREGIVCLVLNHQERHVRPGGTISGPAMMTLTDTAAYFLILSRLGPVALAVTTSLHIDFLRRPLPDNPVMAEASMLKLGKRLAVCSVGIFSAEQRVAQASVTYSLPPRATE